MQLKFVYLLLWDRVKNNMLVHRLKYRYHRLLLMRACVCACSVHHVHCLLVLRTGYCSTSSVLASILIFPKKEFLGSYFQKRGVIHQRRKLHDEARKWVRSLYTTCTEYTKQKYSSIINCAIILLHRSCRTWVCINEMDLLP